jgi:hypothetical protein
MSGGVTHRSLAILNGMHYGTHGLCAATMRIRLEHGHDAAAVLLASCFLSDMVLHGSCMLHTICWPYSLRCCWHSTSYFAEQGLHST